MQISFEEGLVQAVSKGSVIVVFEEVSVDLEMEKKCICFFAFVIFQATGTK